MNLYEDANLTPVQFRPPPPVRANPGPPARGSYSGSRSSGANAGYPVRPSKPPPDIFAGFTGPAIDAASQIAQNFMALIGYPSGIDVNQMALGVLRSGLAGDSEGADHYLFYGFLNNDQRAAHEGSQFGLSQSAYQQRKDSVDSIFSALIGDIPTWLEDNATGRSGTNDLYYNALRFGWSQSQVLQKLQTDDRFSALRAEQPWLAQGQGEQQAEQTYASIYGSAPVDKGTLAAWFRFNTGTTQLNRNAREAITVAAPMAAPTASR